MITSLLFFPESRYAELPHQYGLKSEDVRFKTRDGKILFGWYLAAETPKGVLLFFHGNAGNISGRLYKAKGWVDRGFSVFLIDYRGYGQSQGVIQKGEDIIQDGRASLDWLVQNKKIPLSKIILYGESLGTYPAIQLAGEERAGALILEAPYTSFPDLAALHYPWIPQNMTRSLVKNFLFPNLQSIPKILTPLFILHGSADEICPFFMAEKIFENAPKPKSLFTIQDGAHNDLPLKAGEDYWNKPVQFVLKHLL